MRSSERAAMTILHEHGEEPSNHAPYEEYVRGFDDVPVLDDPVRIPPRRALPPSFVRGERRSQRKIERPDAYTTREARLAENERLYAEYVAPSLNKKRKSKRIRGKKNRQRRRAR